MGKIGRNDPCPCGSGKKYKRCCLPLQEGTPSTAPPVPRFVANTPAGTAFYDDIDLLSNSVLDLIKEGRLDEAESVCKQLSKRYPDQVDGIERMAMVEEARGNYPLAARYYRTAAAFIQGKPGFDTEMISWYGQLAEQMETKASDR